jgi:ubiquinone/menaquinone biosynthesis C-methylase UbiE
MEDDTAQNASALPPPLAMLQMIMGFWVSRTIYIAAKLGLADLIAQGPRTAEDLAIHTGTHARSLYRVLRALAGLGIFREGADGRFSQTQLSETLRSDVPGSMRWAAMVELGQEHFPAWGNVMHSVKTGEIAFDNLYKQDVWAYYAQNPEDAQTFNRSMSGFTQVVNQAVLAGYDFSNIRKLVDVAGGVGSLLSNVLQANPTTRGVLFDLPHVIAEAGPFFEQAGCADRCEFVSGDFFQSVPEGGDVYMMKWIIHDWDDDKSIAILRNIHRAMKDDGRLLLLETVVPAGNEPHWSKFLDLNMMVMTGGCERTEAEFKALLLAAGFRLQQNLQTFSNVNIIEAVK